MKLENKKHDDTYDFKKYKARIDSSHEGKAILALIDLYRDKVKTPIQEIICNARDAHREVGRKEHDFKIILDNNSLKIRDYGSGMTPERIDKIYRSIGATTKGNSNKETGGFGIGAKSPLTYCNSFNVKTYVNGIEYFYSVKRESNGIGVYLIKESKTDKKNGTLVELPIKKDYYCIKQAIDNTLIMWDNKPKVINMKLSDIEKIGKYKLKSSWNRNYVSLDGILYEVKLNLPFKTSVILEKNTGDLMPNQTREFLELSENDIIKLTTEFKNLHNNFCEYLKKDIISCDKLDLLKTKINNYRNHLSLKDINEIISKLNISVETKRYGGYGGLEVYVTSSEENALYSFENNSLKKKVNKPLINHTIFYNDTNLTKRKLLNRIKNHCSKNNIKSFYYIENFKNHKTFFNNNCVNISSMQVNDKKTKVKSKNKLYVYELAYNYKYHVDIETNNKTFLYTDYSGDNKRILREIAIKNNYSSCRITKEGQKLIKGNKNFINISDYLNEFKIEQKHLNYYIKQEINSKVKVNILQYKKSKNKHIVAYVTLLNKINMLESAEFPSIFKNEVMERSNKKLNKYIKTIDMMHNILYSKYSEVFNPNVENIVKYLDGKV